MKNVEFIRTLLYSSKLITHYEMEGHIHQTSP